MTKPNDILIKLDSILFKEGLGERNSYFVISNAYLYLCVKKKISCIDEKLLNIANDMNNNISSEVSNELFQLFDEIEIDVIRDLILYLLSGKGNGPKSFIETSNNNLCELSIKFLEISDKGGDVVLDLGSGIGNFLANTYKYSRTRNANYMDLLGVEINAEQANISKMALMILSDGSILPKIKIGNALDKVDYPYTKGYVFPPLGMRKLLNEDFRKSYLFPNLNLTNRNTGEWIFIDNLLGGLHGGRGVAIVTGKALFNNADIEYRNMLIESGLIEGIIELPAGSLSFTGAKVFMIIFSSDNKYVKFVDASSVVSADNKRYVNLELPVKIIEEMYYSKNVKTKKCSELINMINLTPSTVMLDVKKINNGVELKEVADVFIGNQYTLGVFENKGMLTDKKTGYRILTSGDIEDGIVHWDRLQSIIYNDTKFDKFAVKYGDIVVTSKSSKVKTVVVDIEPKEKILVTGGMLIVRPDLNRLNPTYFKMFLDSTAGQNALKSIQKGSYIVSINASNLSTIEIPLIDIKKQESKAEKYNTELSTLIAYKNEIKRIENSLKNLFEDNEEE